MLNWMYIIAISAAAVGAGSLLLQHKKWTGPYGLMIETRSALAALGAAGVLLLVSAPATLEVLPLAAQIKIPFAGTALIGSTYCSVLSVFRGRWRRIRASEMALWCRQLGLLLQQNVPIIRALDIVADDSRSIRLRDLSVLLREAVCRGEAISGWTCLPPLCGYPAEVIKAGEQSGRLGTALVGLSEVFERRGKLGIHEPRPVKPERPKPEPFTRAMEEVLLEIPEGIEVSEQLLSTRVPGVDAAELGENSPVIRLVNIVIAQAIREGASHVYFISDGGVSVEYGYDEEERRAIITLPPEIRDQAIRRLKLLADVPYWHKPPSTGFINIVYDGEQHRLVLWIESDEAGEESVRLDILPAGDFGGNPG
jgi:hypothetical protein